MLKLYDVVTFEGGTRCVVANKVLHKNHNFYMLVDLQDKSNVLVCGEKIEGGKTYLKEVDSDKLLIELFKLFDANKVC